MAAPASVQRTSNLQCDEDFEFIALNETYCVFKRVLTVHHRDENAAFMRGLLTSKEEQGVATLASAVKYLNGNESDIPRVKAITVMTADLREIARKCGFSEALRAMQAAKRWPTMFDDLQLGLLTLGDFCEVRISDHTISSLDGRLLPIAISFDYAYGGVSNENYDLAQLVDILSKDERVTGVVENSYCPNEQGPLNVQLIPSYDETDTCSQYVPFKFSPTEEDMDAIGAYIREKKGNTENPGIYLRDTVLALDLLGLQAALRAQGEGGWAPVTTPPPKQRVLGNLAVENTFWKHLHNFTVDGPCRVLNPR